MHGKRCRGFSLSPSEGRGLGRGVQFCPSTKVCYDAYASIKPASRPIVVRETIDQTASSPPALSSKGGEGEAAAAFRPRRP